MKTNKLSIARIPVQQSFCSRCSVKIKEALSSIKDITNVNLYPMESLVVFNFVRANQISNALNVLTELGYPEMGEKNNSRTPVPVYSCNGCAAKSCQKKSNYEA
ncbi:MAG: hypothetical protein AAF348_03575 [Bacteroidota bacterium]